MKNLGHDVLTRSARTPVLSAMSALNASAQRDHEDIFGFAGEAEDILMTALTMRVQRTHRREHRFTRRTREDIVVKILHKRLPK